MNRFLSLLALFALLTATWLPLAAPAAAAPARQSATGTPVPPAKTTPLAADVKAIVDKMTAADKVGQLFLVTFQGDEVTEDSDIATLVRDYRVGGVVLLPQNGNFRSVPVPTPPISATQSTTPTQAMLASTPQQILRLTNALQALAASPPRPITTVNAITATAGISATGTVTPTTALTTTAAITVTATVTRTASPTPTKAATSTRPSGAVTPTVAHGGQLIPLVIALDWPGDDGSFFSGTGGFTPLPSAMALGATWTPGLAERVGQVVGEELRAVGVNLLLGPTLDVSDIPRPGNRGDLDIRTFGGDPFWVGQMGQAFIRGLQAGSGGRVVSAAKHFPGQGGSDRRPEDEVATIQKSLQQLRQIELAPFAAVTSGGDLTAAGVTAALMTSHIRYRGFQGNIRILTPPISLAPQLQDLMALKEFADWRAGGGVLISEALGVPAIRRYYDPSLQKFPHRQIAQDAFLAGNDLLYLGRFALTDNWPDQLTAIKETIQYFQAKYQDDAEFRARVDAAVTRVLQLKLQMYGGEWKLNAFQRDATTLDAQVGKKASVTQTVARTGLTLIYPGREELADRMPTAPLADENIVIFTDARSVRECNTCEPTVSISATALQDIILRLYGPSGTGQVNPNRVRSLTYTELNRALTTASAQSNEVQEAIAAARWLIFAQQDYNPEDYPDSAALRAFLAKRSDSLRDKRIVVMALNAPYYLDTTEISKLTAYFGVYSKTAPFLETAVRALFREFTPVGAPPVSVSGINYDLIKQLEPAPGQIIPLSPVGSAQDATGAKASIQVGSRIPLETGIILDRKGHPVPDGTPVEFHVRYPAEALELAPKIETTVGGRARTTVALERPGELWITAQAGEARESTRIVLKVGGDAPGSIATVVPSPTPSPTVTPTSTPTTTPTMEPTPTITSTPAASLPLPEPRRRVELSAFIFGLGGVMLAGGTAFAIRRRMAQSGRWNAQQQLDVAVAAALWAVMVGWGAYVVFCVGWLPGATWLQTKNSAWSAGAVTLIAGLLTLFWSGRKSER